MNVRFAQSTVLALFLICCAALPGVWLYQKSQAVDHALHQDITGTMQQLGTVDVRWNEDVLKSRLGLNPNYDPLVHAVVAQADLSRHLEGDLQAVAGHHGHIFSSLKTYQEAIRTKIDMVEQFKSQNSIFRNSAGFVSLSLRNLLDIMQETQTQSEVPLDALRELEPHIQQLLLGVLEYSSKSQEHTAALLKQQMSTLHAAIDSETIPLSVKDLLIISLNHISIILEKNSTLNTILTDVLSFPIVKRLDSLRAAYHLFYDQLLEQKNLYQTIFFTYLAILAIVCTAFALRLRSRHRIQLLTGMREQLTRELSKTYEELQQSQLRLIQSEKMSALGQMIAGVAHEINTPLAYSRSNVALVHEQLPSLTTLVEEAARQVDLLNASEGDNAVLRVQLATVGNLATSLQQGETLVEMSELLQASLSGLDQITEMVSNLKDFSRLDRKKVDKINLNTGLDSALLIAKNTLKHKVTILKKYSDIPAITCAPSQINQVFLNMLVNAAQAMEDHGTITLMTQQVGDHVNVIIEDDGKGIPADILPHIFDPFFTTKGVGEGTGLGLAISYQIIEQHGGNIDVQSIVGQGTRFTISLPLQPHLDMTCTQDMSHPSQA